MARRSFRERLPTSLWCLAVAVCTSIVISCSLFSVFYTMILVGHLYIGPVEAVKIWLIPFVTSFVAGVAIGNVKRSIKTAPVTLIISFVLAVALSSLPAVLGVFTVPAVADTIVLLAIQYNVYLFLLSFAAILAGAIMGGFIEAE